ncbi:unnamed protein product [Prunus brigantina]
MAKAVTCASTTSMAKLQFAFSSMLQDASALLLCMCVGWVAASLLFSTQPVATTASSLLVRGFLLFFVAAAALILFQKARKRR